MELNPDHAVFAKLTGISTESDGDIIADYSHLLYGQALIAEGSAVPDPAGFARRVAALMTK